MGFWPDGFLAGCLPGMLAAIFYISNKPAGPGLKMFSFATQRRAALAAVCILMTPVLAASAADAACPTEETVSQSFFLKGNTAKTEVRHLDARFVQARTGSLPPLGRARPGDCPRLLPLTVTEVGSPVASTWRWGRGP